MTRPCRLLILLSTVGPTVALRLIMPHVPTEYHATSGWLAIAIAALLGMAVNAAVRRAIVRTAERTADATVRELMARAHALRDQADPESASAPIAHQAGD